MKLLHSIKAFFKNFGTEPTIEDPVFGAIYWDSYWWYVNRTFVPTGEEIGVSIVTADGTEPSEEHRAFYLAIEFHYPLLKEQIVDALFETVMREFEQYNRHLMGKYKREDLWEQLRHEGIEIASVESSPYQWSLSYYCDWSDCVYVIHMADWRVTEIENIGG